MFNKLSTPPHHTHYVHSKDGRMDYLDVSKGLAMLFIIAGHLGVFLVARFVFTFHVPLFFLLSGYFFSVKKGALKLRLSRYLKPYIFTVIVLWLLAEMRIVAKWLTGRCDWHEIIGNLSDYIVYAIYGSGSRSDFFSYNISSIGAIWFFLALAWAIVFMTLLYRFSLRTWLRTAVVLMGFAIGYYTAFITWLPFSFQSGCSALLFLYLGYEIKQRNISPWDNKEALLVSAVVWAMSLYHSFANDHMSLVRSCFPDMLYNVLGACAASFIIVSLCKRVKTDNFAGRYLQTIGRYSAIVLCFHLIELNFVPWHVMDKFVPSPCISVVLIMLGKMVWAYGAIMLTRRIAVLNYFFK